MTPTQTAGPETVTPHVTVLADRCAGCQECVVRCPTGALSLDPASWTVAADDRLCVGCRQCVRTCPFSAITVAGGRVAALRVEPAIVHPAKLLGDRTETRRGLLSWSDALTEASRCLVCPDPTCVRGCPAHNDIPGFIAALAEADLDAAHRVLRRTSILPDVCSRVCDQALQCEGACSWSLAGGAPVAIGALERFVADNAPAPPLIRTSTAGAGLEVVVVGSGPAGAGAAWALAEAGARVTVLERDAAPGGLMRWGIPDFTLPAAAAARPWDALVRAGVQLRCGSDVRAGDIDGLVAAFDAVIIANGAGLPLAPPVAGGDLDGVWDATRFLHAGGDALAAGRPLPGLVGEDGGRELGRSPIVLVLGAGNTAMDVARTARRLGADAICVDWMDRRFAPVRPDELAEAEAEGIEVRFTTTLGRLEGRRGRVAVAWLSRTHQHRADRRPQVRAGTAHSQEVDLVVRAMGYRIDPDWARRWPGVPIGRVVPDLPDREWMGSGLFANPAPPAARRQPVGRLALGRESVRRLAALPRAERVWVVGDALVGPSTVVEAMAQGREVALAVLERRPCRPGREVPSVPRRVLVAYESRGGRTARVAAQVAEDLSSRGAAVRILPLARVGTPELTAADLLVIGTWVQGAVIAGVKPAAATRSWLGRLPPLGPLPVAVFCTYGVTPRRTLAQMRAALERTGARVVAEAGFRGQAEDSATREAARGFARALMEGAARPALSAAPPGA